ncbi:hypothetical protein [Fulvivirga sedimenti]|uniref:Uncharacterized protein n=1 Tax=Fulvivirga sedimenti TaxID=2879465 RepID=A0A9X1HP21_9BACT|nr:hypothetical protein [Fulvivirga sedimenti]MCA6074157.1 hypothetical protein [Fulvivirga sedimenti]
MKRHFRNTVLIMVLASFLNVQAADEDETEFCPGRGERCAYVKVLGIKIWSKKEKDGPGILIKSEK